MCALCNAHCHHCPVSVVKAHSSVYKASDINSQDKSNKYTKSTIKGYQMTQDQNFDFTNTSL